MAAVASLHRLATILPPLLAAALLAGCTAPGGDPLGQDGASPADFGVAGDPVVGDPEAAVAVVAWEAPGCATCASFHFNSFPDLQGRYIDTGQVVWYQQQWTVGYEYDQYAGVALECVHREGGAGPFWPFLDFVFEMQHRIGPGEVRAELSAVAQEHGLDEDALLACYDGDETAAEVAADIQAGRDAGARSSPAYFVIAPDGATGPLTVGGLEQAIEQALAP